MLNRNQLTDRRCRHAEPGFHNDGGGLNLRVLPSGARQWVLRLNVLGTACSLGLGGYPLVSLAQARERALDARRLARSGGDPRAEKRRQRLPVFMEAFEECIEFDRPTWKNALKMEQNVRASIEKYAAPRIGDKRVDEINTDDMLSILMNDGLWHDHRPLADSVRRRVGRVMKWAVSKGLRQDNPASMDVLEGALPKAAHRTVHQRALPHDRVGAALATIQQSGIYEATKLAVEFQALCAARSNEIRGATWGEIEGDTWVIPASKMKAKQEHVVPLSRRALEILDAAKVHSDSSDPAAPIFPSVTGRVMSHNVLSQVFRALEIPAVPHGFRTSFADWCADSGQPREVADSCLAHAVKGVQRAYFRSTMVERRRELMNAWAAYLAADNVVPISKRA